VCRLYAGRPSPRVCAGGWSALGVIRLRSVAAYCRSPTYLGWLVGISCLRCTFGAMTTQRLHSIFSNALDHTPRAALGFLWEHLPTPGLCLARPLTASPVGYPIDWLDVEASQGVRQRLCLRRPSLSPLPTPCCHPPTVVCQAQLASTSRAPRSAVECLSLSLNL